MVLKISVLSPSWSAGVHCVGLFAQHAELLFGRNACSRENNAAVQGVNVQLCVPFSSSKGIQVNFSSICFQVVRKQRKRVAGMQVSLIFHSYVQVLILKLYGSDQYR